ncbi:MAG: LPS export ABC transporter permease LptG [Alphaproteobacteria bacterium]
MKITTTLSTYLAGLYLRNFVCLLLILLGIIYLFDTVELIRRGSKVDDLSLGLILSMGLLKLPEVGQILFPFAVLFGAMFTFWQLNRRYELIVVRAAGFSVWQLLAPVVAVAIVIGAFQIMVINPVGALLLGKFEQMERVHLEHKASQIAVFEEGLWLRQSTDSGYVILNARNIRQADWRLRDVHVLYFDEADTFLQRVDAKSAMLKPGQWVFEDTYLTQAQGESLPFPEVVLKTDLTIADIEDSYASPETQSFWRLPGYIKTLEATGFEVGALKVHYQNLLAQPLLFAAMVLLAAVVSMRPPRSGGALLLISIGVFTGFVVFFLSSFLQALGASHQIPVVLAAWSPALICFMLGVSIIINLEDG